MHNKVFRKFFLNSFIIIVLLLFIIIADYA